MAFMGKCYLVLLTIFSALTLCFFNTTLLEAQVAIPIEDSPNDQARFLDLSYVEGGDFIIGNAFGEEEIAQKLLSNANIEELRLSGQVLSPSLASIIHELPQLKKLVLTGTIRFNDGDGLSYSWESINEQEASKEILQGLIQSASSIEVLDLSLTTVDDNGLEQIGLGAFNLREIYLKGAKNITESGITSLVDKLPNLKLIDLGSVTLREPQSGKTTIAPKISPEFTTSLSNRGIIIIQSNRTPWF